MFRYAVRILIFDQCFGPDSSCHASAASLSLREIDCSLWVSAFLTNCCVIVEPPWTTLLWRMSAQAARTMPCRSIAAVLVEALVLDVDDRVLHPGRDLVPVDEHARLRPAQDGEHGLAVVGVDVAVHRARLRARRIEARQLTCDRRDEPDRERRRGEQEEDREEREEAELADPPSLALCAFPEQHEARC